MVIFHSYVSLPEGKRIHTTPHVTIFKSGRGWSSGPSSASSTDHSLLHPFSAHATHALRMKPRENQRKITARQTAL